MIQRRFSLTAIQKFLLRNVSITGLGLLITQLLQTVGSIILARVLDDPTKFGEANLLLQIFGMTTLFLNVGFNSALVYTFSREHNEAIRTRFRVALVGSTIFGAILAILLSLLAPVLAEAYHLPELRGALVISSIMLVFNSIFNIGLSSFSGNRNFGTQATFMVITTLFSTAGTVLGILLPIGQIHYLESISLWMGVGSILAAAIICWNVQRVHKPQWLGRIQLSELRSMMAFGIPGWAGNIFKAFQQPFLVMMIGSSSVVAVGYLANGFRVTGFIGIVTWAFMIVTFPYVAESSKNPEESRQRGTACIRYNNILLYPLTALICLFPNQITGFLFGASYTTGDSAMYIRLMALGIFFSSVGRLGGNILAGMGKTKANFWVMIIAGIPIVTVVPFIAADNPVWAVWIFTIGWALSALSMIGFFILEQFPPDWWKAYGEPLLPTLVMIAIIEVGKLFGGWFVVFLCVGFLGLLGMSLWIELHKTKETKRRAAFL